MSNKFQVGDKLRITRGGVFNKGDVVTVVEVDPADSFLTYRCSKGELRIWVSINDVEPVSKFAVGEIYKAETPLVENWKGAIIKITGVYEDRVWIKPVRGEAPDYFMPHSQYGQYLTLLTGSQIGEAIKAFDGKKTGVKEVKRNAEVGEYIKIVKKLAEDDPYETGDIFKVIRKSDWFVGDVRVNSECKDDVYVDKLEYVVLEGYKPEKAESPAEPKEERRKAKVGDTIRVLKDNGGPVTAGSVWEVTATDFNLGVKNGKSGGGYVVSRDNYVVLSPGKHRYTDSQIAEAKRIVLDIIREYAEKVSYVLFNKSEDSKEVTAFVTNSESRLGAVPGADVLSVIGFATGVAKCSPNDEPNLWIGKCVALCKALRKPVPRFIMENGAEKRFDYEKAKRKGTSKDAKMVVIHFNDDSERDEALKAIEEMGIKWNTGKKPTEWKNFHDNFLVIKEGSLYYGKPSWESNYVEFSDCFTEI